MPWYLINGSSGGKMAWDMWALLILIWTVVVAPLRLGFDVTDYCPAGIWVCAGHRHSPAIFSLFASRTLRVWPCLSQVWETIIDICFIVDLLLNFFTTIYIKTGVFQGETMTVDMRIIARNYVRSWFVIDFVSSIPIDVVVRA